MSKDRKGAGAMAKTSHKGRRLKWKRMRPLYIMMIPGTLYLIINNYFPMFGIFIAFKKIDYSKGIFASQWTGFDNFRFLFATKDAFVITSDDSPFAPADLHGNRGIYRICLSECGKRISE